MIDAADTVLTNPPISPVREMAAYEALWSQKNASFKTIADHFRSSPGTVPSELVSEEEISLALSRVLEKIEQANIRDYGVRIHGSEDYPERLRDAAHPVEVLYYRGWWDLIDSPKRIAIVGSRKASEEGIRRTVKLVKLLVREGFTIVSGLAKGVDTAAHTAAIHLGGNTIAVIGTPITEYYPPENKALQDLIAEKYLLISQVPIWRYSKQDYRSNRLFFPERNATMSALAQATVIVEASDTSGSLAQARAALKQGRKLFILDNCFRDPKLTWPARFEKMGAIRVKDVDDIKATLG
ncbi:DNA protecting protein DprA [Achromobacter xylosoxidans]|uniref:DNA-processing protein DprA n=1 Tax=Alcaligenes xylosoxydans xylosoxydans TaxID=85698 RepID=UPI0006C44D70|nr:DNA-processing protein DprA [Achromobacter xylosoxidans]CUJ75432.1 DNA protecting protein DprA [Achromobacter xylosoxidans]